MKLFKIGDGLRLDNQRADAAKNTAWILIEKILRLLIGLVVTAWVARYLGPQDFGVLNYGLALIALLSFLPALGLDAVVRSEIVNNNDDAPLLLATTARLRLGAAVVAAVVLGGIVLAQDRNSTDEAGLLLVLGLALFQAVLYVPELYFQALGMARCVTWAQVAGIFIAACMRVGLIISGAALIWFGAAAVIEMLVSAGLLAWLARRQKITWWSGAYSPSHARRLLHQGWPLLLAGAAVMIYMRIDMVMLRMMSGQNEVGLYSAAVRISEAIYFVPVALVTGLMPYWGEIRRAGGPEYARRLQGLYDLQAGLAYFFGVTISLTASSVIPLIFGPDYTAAVPVLIVHVWAGLFVFIGSMRSQEWVFEGLNRLTLWTTLAGAACNVGLNWLLIPAHGAFGAAVATVVSYAVAAWVATFIFKSSRPTAWMQTKALLLPIIGWRYLIRRSQ